MQEPATVETVLGPFQQMGTRVLGYLPSFAAGLLILLLGAVVCWLIKRIAVRVLLLLRLDRPLRSFGWARALSHADVRHALANTAGNAIAALVFLVFLENTLVVWQLDVLGKLMGSLVFFLPRLIVGGIVLLLGVIVSTLVATRVRDGLKVEGFGRAGLAARLVHWALLVVVGTIALEEMGIAPNTVQAAFRIGFGSLGLLTALAVGLGSRDAVARLWGAWLDRPAKNAVARPTPPAPSGSE